MTYQVCGHNGVDRLRLQHHPRRHGVDQHLIDLNIGELFGYIGSYLIPQHHAVSLRVALRHNRQQLPRSASRSLKGKAHQSADAVAGEDRDLCSCLPLLTAVRATALSGVLTLAILADDDPVEVSIFAVPERRLCAG